MPPIVLPKPNKIYVQTSSQEQAKELSISNAAKALTIPLIDPFLCLTVIHLKPCPAICFMASASDPGSEM